VSASHAASTALRSPPRSVSELLKKKGPGLPDTPTYTQSQAHTQSFAHAPHTPHTPHTQAHPHAHGHAHTAHVGGAAAADRKTSRGDAIDRWAAGACVVIARCCRLLTLLHVALTASTQ
jgi:hypothetical protein